jgi:hypothetical protein
LPDKPGHSAQLTGSRGRLVTGLASSALIGVLAVHLLVTAA